MDWNRQTNITYTFCSCRSNDRHKFIDNSLSIDTSLYSLNGRTYLSSPGSCVQNEIFLHRDLGCQFGDGIAIAQEHRYVTDIERVSAELSSTLDMTRYHDFNWELEFIDRTAHIVQGNFYLEAHRSFVRFTALCEQSGSFCSFYLDELDDTLVRRVLAEMDKRIQCTFDTELPLSLPLVWSRSASKVLAKAVSVLLQDPYIHDIFPYSFFASQRSAFPSVSLFREPSPSSIDDCGIPIQRLLVIDEGVPLAWDLTLTRSAQVGIPVIGGQYCDEHSHFFQDNEFSLGCDEMSGGLLRQEHTFIEDAEYLSYHVENDLLFFRAKINGVWHIFSVTLTRLLSSLHSICDGGEEYYLCEV